MSLEVLLIGTLSAALTYSIPLLLGTLGEIYAERSGVVNLGVEGMMLMGALTAFAVAFLTANPWLGLMVAALVGGMASLLHAFWSITLRATQYASGLGLWLTGLGLSSTVGRSWEGKVLPVTLSKITIPVLSNFPYLGEIFFTNQNGMVYLAFGLAVGLWFILFKTKLGIIIRAVGENPAAADAEGINVWKVRYACVLLGGTLAGLAGGYLSVSYLPSWSQEMTGGMGWLVIALTIFVFWHPVWSLAGAYFFGILLYLGSTLQLWVSPALLNIQPYLLTIVVLAFVSRRAVRKGGSVPAALGRPYVREN